MTVYELVLYACVTSTTPGHYSKTCDWHAHGDFFATAVLCNAAAAKLLGAKVQSSTIYVDATNIYEDARCDQRTVTEK